MIIKKNKLNISKILLFFLIGISSIKTHSSFNESDDIDSLFDSSINEVAPPNPLPEEDCLSPIDILSIITPEPGGTCGLEEDICPPQDCIINLPAILQENLYNRTTGPVTRRSLLDEPSLRYYCLDNCPWKFIFHPFYNYSPRVFFTKNSPFIRSYIGLTNENVIREVNRTLELNGCTNLDIPALLGLFNNIKLQQHRAGAIFGICKTFDCFNFSFRIPVYYIVEHFFLADDEKETIENAPFFSSISANPGLTVDEKTEEFGKQHLATDRVGLGDSRLNALYKIYENRNSKVWAGLHATFPTAKTIKAGIIAAQFNSKAKIPEFSIEKLFNLYFCPMTDEAQREANIIIKDTTIEFLIGAIDRLSTILFNVPLGNGGHFGAGPQIDATHQITDCWKMHSFAAIEGFLKKKEDKFFLVKKNPADFQRNFRDEENAAANLEFLNQQLINTLYPMPLKINVRPGVLVKFSHSFIYESGHWNGLFGLDYWYQGEEKLFVNKTILENFDILKGARPTAQQGKLFFSLGYSDTALNDRVLWNVEFTGDGTLFHRGIGENYTIGLRFSLDF